jgi:hypothetical protein
MYLAFPKVISEIISNAKRHNNRITAFRKELRKESNAPRHGNPQ